MMKQNVACQLPAGLLATALVLALAAPGLTGADRTQADVSVIGPNAPEGWRLVESQPWDELQPAGWSGNRGDNASIESIETAPLSPPGVLRHTYPEGFVGGSSADSTHWVFADPQPNSVHIAFTWRPSDPWQVHRSGVDKLVLLQGLRRGSWSTYGRLSWRSGREVQFIWRGGEDRRYLGHNVSSLPSRPGHWYHIEWQMKRLEDLPDGASRYRYRLWMSEYDFEGTLLEEHALRADYEVVMQAQEPWHRFVHSPIWGGVGDEKQESDYFEHSHTAIWVGP